MYTKYRDVLSPWKFCPTDCVTAVSAAVDSAIVLVAEASLTKQLLEMFKVYLEFPPNDRVSDKSSNLIIEKMIHSIEDSFCSK